MGACLYVYNCVMLALQLISLNDLNSLLNFCCFCVIFLFFFFLSKSGHCLDLGNQRGGKLVTFDGEYPQVALQKTNTEVKSFFTSTK